MGYLELLDGMLRGAAHGLSPDFRETQSAWIEAQQAPAGGFQGRDGPPDVYYTDFALRALDLTAPESPAFEAAAGFLASGTCDAADLLEVFSVLSIRRLLRRRGIGAGDAEGLAKRLAEQALPGGGFADPSGRLSAYRSFLGTLCLQMLEDAAPDVPDPSDAIARLQKPSGGFVESPEGDVPQTNATAAGAAVLLITGALQAGQAQAATEFIASMQAPDGGLRAHADVPVGDLLSTFTGLLTRVMIGGQSGIDLSGVARFVRAVARTGGGFAASPADDGEDVEYTFYGIGSLALLRSLARSE